MLVMLAASLSDYAGWIPAIVFPTATVLQIARILKTRSVSGVSAVTWGLFGLANLGNYFYVGKFAEPQAILGFLVTAVLNFIIVGMVLSRRKKRR